jgi:hypothetical protein
MPIGPHPVGDRSQCAGGLAPYVAKAKKRCGDTRLLARIDAAARQQGISRTAWLHVAASKALEA